MVNQDFDKFNEVQQKHKSVYLGGINVNSLMYTFDRFRVYIFDFTKVLFFPSRTYWAGDETVV